MDHLKNIKETVVPEMDWENDKLISWTQFSNWMECPHRWYLMWQEGHKQPPTIHLTFGTALHETLQEYLERMYNQSIKSADEFDMIQDFQERMVKLYDETHKKMGDHYSNREEILEFIEDGFAIIDFFEKYRQSHFSKSGYKLLGIEMPLLISPSEKNPKVKLFSKLDVVLWNEEMHRIKILDIKTSTRGWNQNKKNDKGTTNQLVLYKSWFAKQYNVPDDNVDIEYFIVKRKINEDAPYAAMKSRIQRFSPPSGKTTQNKLNKMLLEFIEENFEGNRYKEKQHKKRPSDKTCKWCPFKDNPNLCDRK